MFGYHRSLSDVETWSPINRAAYYDSKEDYERSVGHGTHVSR